MASSIYRVTSLAVILITALTGFGWTLQIKIEPQPYNEVQDTWLNVTCVVNETSDWRAGRDILVVTRQDTRITNQTTVVAWMREEFFHYRRNGSYFTTSVEKPMVEEMGTWSCVLKKRDDNRVVEKRVTAVVQIKEYNVTEVVPYLMTMVKLLMRKDGYIEYKVGEIVSVLDAVYRTMEYNYMDLYNHVTGKAACDKKGWTFYEYDNTCVKVFAAKHNDSSRVLSWNDARKECGKHNGSLAEIHDERKNGFVTELLNGSDFNGAWIGQRNRGLGKVGLFRYLNWLGLSHYQPWQANYSLTYENLYPFRRINYDRCVSIYTTTDTNNGKWSHRQCSQVTQPYVCSISSNGCPDATWIVHKENKTCIRLFSPETGNYTRSWEDAREACKGIRPEGDLLSMTEDRNNLVRSMMKNMARSDIIWIGVRNQTEYGKNYTYADRTPLGAYQPWTDTMNSRRKRCVAMFPRDGKWKNFNCGSSKNFLCSVPIQLREVPEF